MPRTPWFMLTASVVLALLTLGGTVGLLTLASWEPAVVRPVPTPQPVRRPRPPEPKPEPGSDAKRFAVAGEPGTAVVVAPDGGSFLENAEGSRIVLDSAKADSQLIVLDRGIVKVPRDAIITHTGEDHLVVHSPEGGSTAYYTNGMIRTRESAAKVMRSTPPAGPLP